MTGFVYRARRADGGVETGRVEAATRVEAAALLEERGLTPVRIEAAGGGADRAARARFRAFSWRGRRISSAQVEEFLRAMSGLLAAGISLSRALDLLARETVHPAAAARWRELHARVVDGMPLAAAMERSGGIFTRVQVAMVEAGEAGGFLDVVLAQIADFMARERDLRARVWAAAMYPAVLFVIALGVLSFLLVFFIPRFQRMFEGFDAPLPALTVAIVSLSHFLRRHGLWLVAAAAVGGIALRRRWRDEARRRAFERRFLRLPVLGDLARRLAVARFSRMLGALLTAGVPLVPALRAARRSLGYSTLVALLDESLEAVQKGESLAAALGRHGGALFPRTLVETIAVAEESGRLDRELTRVADDMERTFDRHIRAAVALAEPALLFVIAAFVGTIFIGMILPIFTLQEYIR
jgi:type II secretory pathway component PulF